MRVPGFEEPFILANNLPLASVADPSSPASPASSRRYDVIVVGAGPAGCSAAFYLAKRGLEVLLVDKARFPRGKTCGDGVGAASTQFLANMGVLEKLEAGGAQRITQVLVSSPDGTIVSGHPAALASHGGYAVVAPRQLLDAVLLDHVRAQPHVTVLEGFKAAELARVDGVVCGVTGTLGGVPTSLRGDFVVGADGANSLIAVLIAAANRQRAHRQVALRAYFDDVDLLTDRIEIHFTTSLLPGYGWVFPTGARSANVGVYLSPRPRTTLSPRDAFHDFVQNHPLARRNLAHARLREGTLTGWTLPSGSFRGPRGVENVLLVGDAASFIDPLTGEGIYYGLRSGQLAAEAIASVGSRPAMATPAYERLWRRDFQWREFVPARLFRRLLRSPWVVDTVFRTALKSPRRTATLLGAVGHTVPKASLLFSL
jgi:geranylgeranyl reductase family protein